MTNYIMGKDICQSLSEAISKGDSIFNRVILDNNGFLDSSGAEILDGLSKLLEVKSLVYIKNDFSINSLESLKLILHLKPIPHHLEELRLVHCGRLSSVVTGRLLDILIEKSPLRKLSLVNAGINDEICLRKLSQLVQGSRQLTELDISWNRMRPNILFDFMDSLGEIRHLQYLNLSWNNLIERGEITDPQRNMLGDAELSMSESDILKIINKSLLKKSKRQTLDFIETQVYIMAKLTRFIKYNRNLLHLDLTHTGLNQLCLRIIGISLRRACSLLSIHLSENPGITSGLKTLLFERIHCKPL